MACLGSLAIFKKGLSDLQKAALDVFHFYVKLGRTSRVDTKQQNEACRLDPRSSTEIFPFP